MSGDVRRKKREEERKRSHHARAVDDTRLAISHHFQIMRKLALKIHTVYKVKFVWTVA